MSADAPRHDRAGAPIPPRDLAAGLPEPGVIIGHPSDRGTCHPLQIGPDACLRSGSVLYDGSRIGSRLQTGHGVVIREHCQVGDDVSIWSNTVIDYGCRIGNGVKVHCNCYVAQYTEIQDGAFLAPGVTIANDLYPGDPQSAALMSGPWIGARAQIGVNVTILPFVRIGAGALIGSGAVVTRDVPAGTVAFGNPAVVRGQVADLAPVTARVSDDPRSVSRHRFAVAESAPGGGSA
jgi:acetyltransferase-like isoleucine patch superfamily enzyme